MLNWDVVDCGRGVGVVIMIPAQHRDVCQPSSIGPTLELDLTATASQTVSKLFYNALSRNDHFIFCQSTHA